MNKQPDWLILEGKDKFPYSLAERENKEITPSNMIIIENTFDILGFHFKSDDPNDQLKIMFYNNDGNMIILYLSGKGNITKLDTKEKVLLPLDR